MTSVRTVASLIASVMLVQLAQGLLGVFLPLAMRDDQIGAAGVGVVAALYSIGFMAGAWFGPRLLARVGHIRVFAVCAAAMTAATLALHSADGVLAWALLRMATGAAVALMFAAVESWLQGSIPAAERGGVIGVYMVCTKAVLALGPFLALGAAGQAAGPLMLAAGLIALAITPVGFTSQAQPEPPKPQRLDLAEQYKTAPAAVAAAIGAGVTNTAVLTLAPLYAAHHFGEAAAAPFQAAAWIGSLILQYPAGKLSDRMDRRLVIAWLAGLSAAAAAGLALLGANAPFPAAALLFALWGAGSLSYYGIAVAHMADRAEPGQIARSTSGLLFVWGAGSIVGPLIAGPLMAQPDSRALFWFAALAGLLLTAAMLTRRRVRRPTPERAKEAYAGSGQTTSVVSGDLSYELADQRGAPAAPDERPQA